MLYMGVMGSVIIVKVVFNMIVVVNVVIMIEVMLLGKRGGVDLKFFFDVIWFSVGNMYMWEMEVFLVFNGMYDLDFIIGFYCKDLNFGY